MRVKSLRVYALKHLKSQASPAPIVLAPGLLYRPGSVPSIPAALRRRNEQRLPSQRVRLPDALPLGDQPHPLLTVEEEQSLARAYVKGETRAAHRLITANLRFVVKIAYEYRSYGLNLADLVQEGNIGLMKAVQKFDPERGIRFVSYAVWWIRAYIQNSILRSFSLVKIGTTQAQRKLFFSLARTKRELDQASAEHGLDSDGEDVAKIAKKLNVKPGEVVEMSQRMGRDLSLDAPVSDEGGFAHIDFLAAEGPAQDHAVSSTQERTMLQGGVGAALAQLDPRERFIVE